MQREPLDTLFIVSDNEKQVRKFDTSSFCLRNDGPLELSEAAPHLSLN